MQEYKGVLSKQGQLEQWIIGNNSFRFQIQQK